MHSSLNVSPRFEIARIIFSCANKYFCNSILGPSHYQVEERAVARKHQQMMSAFQSNTNRLHTPHFPTNVSNSNLFIIKNTRKGGWSLYQRIILSLSFILRHYLPLFNVAYP